MTELLPTLLRVSGVAKKNKLDELGSFGLVFSKNIPMSVDDEEDEETEKLKQLPETSQSSPKKIVIRIGKGA